MCIASICNSKCTVMFCLMLSCPAAAGREPCHAARIEAHRKVDKGNAKKMHPRSLPPLPPPDGPPPPLASSPDGGPSAYLAVGASADADPCV